MTDDPDDREPTELKECPVCGAVGLPERIEDHDCEAFRTEVIRGP
jgi:hypothetical protein